MIQQWRTVRHLAVIGLLLCSGCASSLECALVEAYFQAGPDTLEDRRDNNWWVVVIFDCSENLDSFVLPQAIAGAGEELIGGADKISDTAAPSGFARYIARLHWSYGAHGSAEELFAAAAVTGLPVWVRGHSMFRSPTTSNVMVIPADRVAQFLDQLRAGPNRSHGPGRSVQ